MPRLVSDYTNKKFGKLTAVYFITSDNGIIWSCKCTCGNFLWVSARKLREVKWKKLKLMCDECKLQTYKNPTKTKLYRTLFF